MQAKYHMHGQTRRIVIDVQSDDEMLQVADALSSIAPDNNISYDLMEFASDLQNHVGKRIAKRKQTA